MKTFSMKAGEIKKRWILIDAKGAVVGRLASFVASVLRGKNKPEYTPHMDCGDNVIIINAGDVFFSGSKMKNKVYYRHTGYPGGIKSTTPEKVLCGKYPERVLKMAVWRMMDDGPMARRRMKNLYVYPGSEHKHAAQKPIFLEFSSLNSKNNGGLKNE